MNQDKGQQKANADNRSNQMNPNSDVYSSSRMGNTSRVSEPNSSDFKHVNDNRSNQMNPNSKQYSARK